MGVDEDGTPLYFRETFATQAEAKERLAEKLAERRDGGVVKPSTDTVRAFLKDWFAEAGASLRENTAESYERIIRRYLVPELGTRKLAGLQPLALQQAYRRLRERGLSSRTVRYAHAVLHRALEDAVKWRLLTKNPAAGLELPRRQPVRTMRPLTQEEAQRLLRAATARNAAGAPVHRLGTYFVLALVTGMRPSELCGLRWQDVSLDERVVRVRQTLVRDKQGWRLREPKTTAGRRTIPIPAATVDELRSWQERQQQERDELKEAWTGPEDHDEWFVFTTRTGEPTDITNLTKRDLLSVARAAGFATEVTPKPPRKNSTWRADFTLYDLRHTCATLMITAGVNPKVASERLGHASVVITLDTYTHVLPTMQADATEKLGGLLYD